MTDALLLLLAALTFGAWLLYLSLDAHAVACVPHVPADTTPVVVLFHVFHLRFTHSASFTLFSGFLHEVSDKHSLVFAFPR